MENFFSYWVKVFSFGRAWYWNYFEIINCVYAEKSYISLRLSKNRHMLAFYWYVCKRRFWQFWRSGGQIMWKRTSFLIVINDCSHQISRVIIYIYVINKFVTIFVKKHNPSKKKDALLITWVTPFFWNDIMGGDVKLIFCFNINICKNCTFF